MNIWEGYHKVCLSGCMRMHENLFYVAEHFLKNFEYFILDFPFLNFNCNGDHQMDLIVKKNETDVRHVLGLHR